MASSNSFPSHSGRWTHHAATGFALVFSAFTTWGAAALPADTALPPQPAPLPEVTFPLLRIFGALALVLALFAAGAWLFRNWQTLPGLGRGTVRRSSRLRMLEMRSLGNRQALFVVAYEHHRLLVAASPAGITLVDRLPPASGPDPETEAAIATASSTSSDTPAPVRFADALRNILPSS